MMKLLLLCLGLTLVCVHAEVVTKNFDVPKLSGEWYTILLASNLKEVIKEDGAMRAFVDSVEASDNSSAVLKIHIKINGKCVPVTLLAHKISEDAVYSINYPGVNRIRIIEAVYDDYMIIHFYNAHSDDTFYIVGLYARTPDKSPEFKEEFKRIGQKFGIPKDNVIDLTKTDRCLQSRDN
ncbi:lipocalin Can f 6.0101-like isoform X2 [Rousettus aegyptiacus]|uniref:lipocalin Can f 6.0101-like isoform X2 n=1 Tax=Rousettus aegyptiacus TaxID=9407 RepID=UPI00168CEFEB|nr:lipocalin Can f 6.0101-like isoform X2 [Rousettus aegyptiacus]